MSVRSNEDAVVYIVDDSADVREGLKSLLESVGLRCEIFSSTTEFLQRIPTEGPGCLILDIRLPGTGGLDFQKQLANSGIAIPIIFITGYGDIPMSVKAMKAGAVEFLTKPLREQDILDAVRVAIDRDRAQREHGREVNSLRTRFETLSDREREVMFFVTAGLMNKQTAARIGLSEPTVKAHRRNVMIKLGAKSTAELVRMADVLGVSRPK